MAKEKNMSQEAAEKIIKKIIEILEIKEPNFEGKLADLEAQVRSIETNYINLGITHAAQTLKYKKLLKENLALRKRIEILEKKKP